LVEKRGVVVLGIFCVVQEERTHEKGTFHYFRMDTGDLGSLICEGAKVFSNRDTAFNGLNNVIFNNISFLL
jgi:hypothetical protein